ncbi:hypothetical protein C0Q70_14867 [Pomacea canaliculata]|uniref:protein-tyrosine-phosphatase n=1 Tax=Pomacea canaliculata TaxID=400727 RepID=A0A2T7NT87_POMCA|nr:hypothetical protein C0Q70_14867 [Pomacea canaliculata]
MSSVYTGGSGHSGPACLAVNGNRSHVFVPLEGDKTSNCIHTSEKDTRKPFWEVDLNGTFTISDITIYFREKSIKALSNAIIEVNKSKCYTFKRDYPNLVTNISCTRPLRGQTVRVSKSEGMMIFCELEVWGCEDGYYGDLCDKTCENCKNMKCEQTSGRCVEGCQSGWREEACDQACDSGTFGPDCKGQCGACKSKPCDRFSGRCDGGCAAGYTSPYCNTTCTNSTYGENCAQTCGHCAGSEQCNVTSGHCRECQEGHDLPFCKSEGGGNSLVVAGVSVVVVLLLLIIFIIIFVVIRKKRRWANHSDLIKGLERDEKINKGQGDNFYINMKNLNQETCSKSSQNGLVTEDELDIEEAPGADESDVYTNDESIYATFQKSSPKLDSLQLHLVDIVASGQLPLKFKELPKGLTAGHEAAKLKINSKKNRYASILPYDDNRVVLQDGLTEGEATDYINASYISGFEHSKRYIASQGPRDTTVGDFWRMVWQEKITQIVMLTNTIERGQMKCLEYWPAQDKTVTHGPVTVTGVNVQRRANFLVRTFALRTHHSKVPREVEQYHYLAWPDHGVPTTSSLLNFWRFAKSRAPRQSPPPVLVHCAAGVGRTGTYIGLDIAFDQASATGSVDVFDVVMRMRQERCIMVQAADQFVFLHKAVLEAYTGRNTTIPSEGFEAVFRKEISAHKQDQKIDKEFETVRQMNSLTPKPTQTTAERPENISKIRNSSALPGDKHLVLLKPDVSGQSQFINAVFMSTYREHQGSIVTQLPLPDTLAEFWTLVEEQDVRTIVSLGSQKDSDKVKDFCQFWPLTEKRELKAGAFVIKTTSTSQLGRHLTAYKLTGQSKAGNVCLLRYEGWEDEVPADMSDLLALVDHLDAERLKEKETRPVIIQCTFSTVLLRAVQRRISDLSVTPTPVKFSLTAT